MVDDKNQHLRMEVAATNAATLPTHVENHSSRPNPFADQKLHWTESVPGKLAIRTISRGVLGAAFFAWGARYSGQQMQNYNPGGTNMDRKLKPLEHVASIIDKLIGTPIELAGDIATGNGKDWVTFRPTRSWGSEVSKNEPGKITRSQGRTLGAEVVGITFDFAMASVGNGIGDEIALGIFNPKARARWMKDGKFELGHAVKTLCQRAWHIVSYRAGEDLAVAVPYAFYLRAQRNLLDKIDPGFRFDSDRAMNGASVKVDDNGKIVGDYQATGMVDLWGRFTAYNVMTLMYREAYRYVADTWKGWKENGFGLPRAEDLTPAKLFVSTVQAAKDVSVWAARSVVKGVTIMLPSVPFFFVTRSPQSKFMGMAINPKKGAVAFYTKDSPEWQQHPGEWNMNHANMGYENFQRGPRGKDQRLFDANSKTYFVSDTSVEPGVLNPPIPNAASPFKSLDEARTPYNAYAHGIGKWGKFTDTIGGSIFKIGNYIQDVGGSYIPKSIDKISQNKTAQNLAFTKGAGRDLTRKYVNAAAAYTPYFMMKTDIMGNLYDNQQMNVSIERAIRGITNANWSEFKAGVGDYITTLRRKPLQDEKSLTELGQRMEDKKQDSSPTNKEYAKSFVEKLALEPQKEAAKEHLKEKFKDGYAAQALRDKAQRDTVLPSGVTFH